MGIEEDIKYWVEISKYDLDTAKAMLDGRRYLYVLFMSQQSLEKILKALVVKVTKSFPPRLHNLSRLAEIAEIELDAEQRKFLEKLSHYYIGTRYPEDRKKIAASINRKAAQDYCKKTKEIWQWLKKQT